MWYVVDAVDRVAELSPDWLAAAQRGGAPGLLPDAVIGRPIWSFIEGETVCFHYHVCPACEGILRREGHLACAERSLTP